MSCTNNPRPSAQGFACGENLLTEFDLSAYIVIRYGLHVSFVKAAISGDLIHAPTPGSSIFLNPYRVFHQNVPGSIILHFVSTASAFLEICNTLECHLFRAASSAKVRVR